MPEDAAAPREPGGEVSECEQRSPRGERERAIDQDRKLQADHGGDEERDEDAAEPDPGELAIGSSEEPSAGGDTEQDREMELRR